MAMKLEGCVALVTGASSGIGKATATAFAKEGAKVVIAARREVKLDEVAAEIKSAGGEVAVVVGDVSKEMDCKKMVDTAIEKFGGLHVAFNNAGVFKTVPFVDITEDTIDDILNTNVKSIAWCLKYQIPAMKDTAGGKGSIIVNTSVTGLRPSALPGLTGAGMYSASKAAAEMLMKYAAIEGAASGVRVNSVAPGLVETPIFGDMPVDTLVAFAGATQLVPRPCAPEEIAKVVIFLASEDATMVTGSTYTMDGGWAMKA
ncbi:short-chain dehydrogenase/reductase SDR [Ectocarpus siliculosus]|uniref:Short-chain dehydrogenase/reductase SDR n=1 Tax=Ectocarpus siliculosus TaxID=2880 RepID=D8LQS1_ECTSI|nr:short-chain dehydrogenase/reductase SDR [Ectocarpus siliculosus]|eukprot:CBN74948.1 short-chain dehydrogenase/reductase SDR [Ectocarpus siliculosus]